MAAPTLAPADDAPHLLIVDDDRRIRSLLSRYLLSEGYRVTTAESAADARARLAGLDFDLLILDVMMPGETGFELVKSIRRSSTVPGERRFGRWGVRLVSEEMTLCGQPAIAPHRRGEIDYSTIGVYGLSGKSLPEEA